MAPREIDADIQQSIGTSAWAAKFHDGENAVGLPGSQGHRPARGVVRRGIDAQNEIAGSDRVAHSFHPLPREKIRPGPERGKDRIWRKVDTKRWMTPTLTTLEL